MTTAKQMFALQELDIVLDRIQGDQDKAEHELTNGDTVGNLETELERDTEWLQETELQQKATRLESESQKIRSESLNSQLYGGEITNPRDLENLEREAAGGGEDLHSGGRGKNDLRRHGEVCVLCGRENRGNEMEPGYKRQQRPVRGRNFLDR